MYALYRIEMPPIPLSHNIPPIKFLSGGILNPISVQNPTVRAEILDPVSASVIVSNPSTTTIASLAWPSSCTKGSAFGYPDSAASLLAFTDVPCSPPFGMHLMGQVGDACSLPLISIKGVLRHS